MRLLGFHYLQRHRMLTLMVILTISSTLFTITAFSVQGYYRSFNAFMGEGEDIVAIYDRGSQTPFTGLIPKYLTERIGAMSGVLACSPEVIFPCVIKDESIFLRGIIPEDFLKLNQLTLVDGDMLELSDINSMIVGRGIAERLNLKIGDIVLILGTLKNQYLELRVQGIYESHSTMDDEILAPLYVGQWLRGWNYGTVTIIRVRINRSEVSPTQIFEEVAKEASEPSPGHGGEETGGIIPWMIKSFKIENVGVEDVQTFMKNFMERYGMTKEALLILSIMVFLFASATISSASRILLRQHGGEINVLRSVGASNRTIKIDLSVKVLGWSLAASTLGIILATAILILIERNSYLQVLSHSVFIQFDPIIVALNFALISLIVTLSIIRSDLK